MHATLSAFSQCWEVLMDDYGLFSTIAAATTLAALVFLVFVVLRTLSPKPKPNVNPHTEKKKKKKKGNSRKRDHHHQRHGTSLSSSDRIDALETTISTVDGMTNRDVSAQVALDENHGRNLSVDHRMDNMAPISEAKPTLDCSHSTPDPSLATPSSTVAETAAATVTLQGTNARQQSKEERSPISSTSTVETTALSDDQSCESTSVRSSPSVSASSSRSGDKVNKKKNTSTPRRAKRGGGRLSITPDRPTTGNPKARGGAGVPHVSSRWDALKPEQGNGNVGGNNINSINQHQPPHANGKGRRHGDNGGDKKPRPIRYAPSGKKIAPPTTAPKPRSNKTVRSPKELHHTVPVDHTVTPEPSPSTHVLPPPPPPPGFQNDTAQDGSFAEVSSNWEGLVMAGSTDTGMSIPKDQDVVTALLHTPLAESERNDWRMAVADHGLFPSTPSNSAMTSHIPFGGSAPNKVQENPFTDNGTLGNNTTFQTDLDSQIEADLQELGGQMAGSILDF